MSVGLSRRVFVVAATVVVVTLVCAAPVAAAQTVPVKDWTGSLCEGFSKWDARLTKLEKIGGLADPSAGKAAITKYLTGAARVTDRLAKDLKSAGVPAIKDGTAIAAAWADSVESLRAVYAEAKTTAVALPTAEPAAFATAVQALAVPLQTAGTTLNSTLATAAARYPSPALVKAFRSTKACQALQ